MLNVILKDFYNTNTNYDEEIKNIIISSYKKNFNEENNNYILKKWQQENKPFESVITSSNPFKQIKRIIESSEYRITVIDIIMFMFSQKIPILLLYQSKKTKNFDGIKLFYMMESDYYYIIKLRNNKIFMLHMWTFRKNARNQISSIRFNNQNITTKLKEKMLKPFSIQEYFEGVL
jgi:hypothetical protein